MKRDFEEDQEFVDRQIALILEYTKVVITLNKVDIVKADPEDNKIIECALTGNVNYIISGDPHLFNLKEIFGIKILKPRDFLDEIN